MQFAQYFIVYVKCDYMHKVHHTTSQHASHLQYIVNVSLHMNIIYSTCMYNCMYSNDFNVFIFNVYIYVYMS